MLKIYGADLSAPANKVRMAAHVLDLEYEYIRVSIKDRENQAEEYLKMHPAGKVPMIDDDGFVLFESDAIIKYLATKHKSPLYPTDEKKQALTDQWMDSEENVFLKFEVYLGPYYEGKSITFYEIWKIDKSNNFKLNWISQNDYPTDLNEEDAQIHYRE